MARHRLNDHHLMSQSTVSAAGPPRINAVIDAQSQLYYGSLPGFRRAYARVQLLSVLRYFLRKQGMRDSASAAVPVAVLPVPVAVVVRYQVLSRRRVGRRYRVWARLGPN